MRLSDRFAANPNSAFVICNCNFEAFVILRIHRYGSACLIAVILCFNRNK